MASYSEYPVPKEHYLPFPTDESCYEYLHICYNNISKDIGDYSAFVTPIADQLSDTSMTKLMEDIEKLSAFFAHKGLKKGDVVAILGPPPHLRPRSDRFLCAQQARNYCKLHSPSASARCPCGKP